MERGRVFLSARRRARDSARLVRSSACTAQPRCSSATRLFGLSRRPCPAGPDSLAPGGCVAYRGAGDCIGLPGLAPGSPRVPAGLVVSPAAPAGFVPADSVRRGLLRLASGLPGVRQTGSRGFTRGVCCPCGERRGTFSGPFGVSSDIDQFIPGPGFILLSRPGNSAPCSRARDQILACSGAQSVSGIIVPSGISKSGSAYCSISWIVS